MLIKEIVHELQQSKLINMIKVIIADDHKLFREGMISLLSPVKGIKVIGEAESSTQLLEHLSEKPVDVAVMDMKIDGTFGTDLTKTISSSYPEVKILMLSGDNDWHHANSFFEAGAKGFTTKSSSSEDFIKAIRTVSRGDSYLYPGIDLNKKIITGETSHLSNLSKREIEVLQLIAEGFTNAEIAEKLFTSRRTIESHRKNLIEKTGVKNTASLIRYAVEKRLL